MDRIKRNLKLLNKDTVLYYKTKINYNIKERKT